MSELLQAAKAVIEQWDRNGYPIELVLLEPLKQLRAAVEWAEKQESFEFDAWWESAGCGGYWDAHAAWTAAQQAERERVKTIIREVTGGFGNCDRLLEKIDAPSE